MRNADAAQRIERSRPAGWLVLLLVFFWNEASALPPIDADSADAAALAHYLISGGNAPPWADSTPYRALLVAETRAHGLSTMTVAPNAVHSGLLIALRLARVLSQGSVAPASVQSDWKIRAPEFDRAAALRTLGTLEDPLPWLRSLASPDPEYARMEGALERYASIVQRGGWPSVPDGLSDLEPGAIDGRMPILQRRLKIEGDLAAEVREGLAFDAATKSALRRFQARHGLAADGRLGRKTSRAMNVSADARYRQIAANMERWRWLPRPLPAMRVTVNAASATLSVAEGDGTQLELRTIVGTREHPTPVLGATISSLLLNPPWEIPSSIATNEIWPRQWNDAGYFEREGILAADSGQLRQSPGPRNALGRIKFEMPNGLDIYLHDTPTRYLFERSSRFFSHGCIRVEKPEQLALYLRTQDPEWTATAIRRAIATGRTIRLSVKPEVPVYVLYFTSLVDERGTVMFYDDIYDRDPPLTAALFPDNP